MIRVVAKSEIMEGQKEKVLEILEEMIEKTRMEDGCISYELYEDVNKPNVITFIEEWENMDKLKAHMNSEHFVRIIPSINQYKIDPQPAEVYKKIR